MIERYRLGLGTLLALLQISHSWDAYHGCSELTNDTLCNSNANIPCQWVLNEVSNGTCQSNSDVNLDILFAIDTSNASYDLQDWRMVKDFTTRMAFQDINYNVSKIGFVLFGTHVNLSRHITTWQTTELFNYLAGLSMEGEYRNTAGAVQQALYEFDGTNTTYVPDPQRQQIMVLITGGNPCLPDSLGGCPSPVCQYRTEIDENGIRVIIIGVGSDLNEKYVKCLTQTDDDFIPISSYSAADLYSIIFSSNYFVTPTSSPSIKPQNTSIAPSQTPTNTDQQSTVINQNVTTTKPFNISSKTVILIVTMTIVIIFVICIGISFMLYRKKTHDDTENKSISVIDVQPDKEGKNNENVRKFADNQTAFI